MTKGYVIFNTKADFDTLHEQAKIVKGLPIVGYNMGVPAPHKQQTIAVTEFSEHYTDGDNRGIAYIDDYWPANLKTDFVYKTKDQIKDFYPPEEKEQIDAKG